MSKFLYHKEMLYVYEEKAESSIRTHFVVFFLEQIEFGYCCCKLTQS